MIQPSRPSWEDKPYSMIPDAPIEISWQSIQMLLPRGMWRRSRSRRRSCKFDSSEVAALSTSFSPFDTLRVLQSHRWTVHDYQYVVLALLGLFSLYAIENPGPLVKTLFSCALLVSLSLPVTSQFMLPGLPTIAWLAFWYACQFIPSELRPSIWVRVLPAIENIIYGVNLSDILSEHHMVLLDVLAWLPYGIFHYIAPLIVVAFLFIFGPPKMAPIFARSFGFLCIIGVVIQFLFPCSPPWYEDRYGFAPASYGMPGSPGGLARIDRLFGVDMYTSSFTANPVPFGAFPSLHAGSAALEAMFMSLVFHRLRFVFWGYAMWVWWATMYLSHHYAVDLMGGGILAVCIFFFVKGRFVPRVQKDKATRWEYVYVEIGEERLDYSRVGLLPK